MNGEVERGLAFADTPGTICWVLGYVRTSVLRRSWDSVQRSSVSFNDGRKRFRRELSNHQSFLSRYVRDHEDCPPVTR